MTAKHHQSDRFGEAEYRQGAIERLEESFDLLCAERYAGSIYLAGRSVEAILRAAAWKADLEFQKRKKTLETGHDLRELLSLVRHLGVLPPEENADFLGTHIQYISRLWFNNMRFASNRWVESRWRKLGEVHRRRTLKQASKDFHTGCAAVLKKCEALWQH